MLNEGIFKLVEYGMQTKLLPPCEAIYATNLLLDVFKEDTLEDLDESTKEALRAVDYTHKLEEILAELLNEAVRRELISDSITEKDLFDTRIMNCLMPRPSTVQENFKKAYDESPEKATDYYYNLSRNSDYIRTYRVKKDLKWTVDSPYGVLDITINLSKPEKDPKAIAAAKNAPAGGYPKCLLCMENEGYAGRLNHPARQNHRIQPITINNQPWGFQYSPYVYYNEHCIVFNGKHTPMKIEQATFEKLFDFVDLFPHYFLGSNADLPIVGGSILSHDHFQGGHYTFAIEKAPVIKEFAIAGFEDVSVGIVHWPLSVLRLNGKSREQVIALATKILHAWRNYTDEEAMIYANTDGEAHNTITPIARKKGDLYELDLALRNNLTTKEHPLGLYHPHQEYHHIKKENIGLIEVMGLAVLPARLKNEMELIIEYITQGKDVRSDERIAAHADWLDEILPKYPDFTTEELPDILKKEIGIVFTHVLENAGVYKCTEEGLAAFQRFIKSL